MFLPFPITHESPISFVEEGSDRLFTQFMESFFDEVLDVLGRCFLILMDSLFWFSYDAIDDLELEHILRSGLEKAGHFSVSSLFFLSGFFVETLYQNAGTAFGRDHRKDRIFQHVCAISDLEGECAAATAFADDDTHSGHFEARKSSYAVGYFPALEKFGRLLKGIPSWSVDERDQRFLMLFCEFHDLQCE